MCCTIPRNKETVIFLGIFCLCINGFNVADRLSNLKPAILEKFGKAANYIPDVHAIAKHSSEQLEHDVILGLAAISAVGDGVLILSAMSNLATPIYIVGWWSVADAVCDLIIGFASANYTMPGFQENVVEQRSFKNVRERQNSNRTSNGTRVLAIRQIEKSMPAHDSASSHRNSRPVHLEQGLRELTELRLKYAEEQKQLRRQQKIGLQTRHEERKVGLRNPGEGTIRQIFHFFYVIMRFIFKMQMVCLLFGYSKDISTTQPVIVRKDATASGID